MPVATPQYPWRVGIDSTRHWRGHPRSCVDRSWHHIDCRRRINRGRVDRWCRVRRWGRRCCVPLGRWRQTRVAIGRGRQISSRRADRGKYKRGCSENESLTYSNLPHVRALPKCRRRTFKLGICQLVRFAFLHSFFWKFSPSLTTATGLTESVLRSNVALF